MLNRAFYVCWAYFASASLFGRFAGGRQNVPEGCEIKRHVTGAPGAAHSIVVERSQCILANFG